MRKRKRGCGTYVDEDTGQSTVVQTTKQAKRNHQKHGKWYKEPTSQEIRAWDREEKRHSEAEKAQKREENRKINAAKRAKNEAKEQSLKKQLFDAGKITFTQTLAKKDASQPNLHAWFGGRPKKAVCLDAKRSDVGRNDAGCRSNENRENEVVIKRREQSEGREDLRIKQDPSGTVPDTKPAQIESPKPPAMDQPDALDLLIRSDEFDIAEDELAAFEAFRPEDIEQDSLSAFQVPALPNHEGRLPLSPMSQSDLNVRSAESLHIGSFLKRCEEAGFDISGTQAARELLGGISTQDLIENLEDDFFDEDEDKENTVPSSPLMPESPIKPKPSPLKSVQCVEQEECLSDLDFDDDDPFADLNEEIKLSQDEFVDDGLDDAAMLAINTDVASDTNKVVFNPIASIDTTQTTIPISRTSQGTFPVNKTMQPVCLANKSVPSKTSASAKSTHKSAQPQLSFSVTKSKSPPRTRKLRSPLAKVDSFALEGLDDADLLAELEQFERGQSTVSTNPPTADNSRR